jgi:hypothetical protein
MNSPSLLFRVIAVVSAVCLTGGLICYQTGAFNTLLSPKVTAAVAEPTAASADNPSDASEEMKLAAMAEQAFRQLDIDGDLYLNYEEMTDRLKEERDKWDMDQDGLIDLIEFTAYYKALFKQASPERQKECLAAWPVSPSRTPRTEASSESKNDAASTEKPATKFLGGTKSSGYIVNPEK